MTGHRIFDIAIEMIYWVLIAASPFLFSCLIAGIIFFADQGLVWLSMLIVAIGLILGKYGCARYVAKILATPDIWPDDLPEESKENKKK
jgi:hypothetical protein